MLDRVGGLLARVGEIVRSCHERWDGRGYPDGLAGEQIPLAARIVFACDAYNAMTTDRPYRAAMSREAAVAELRANTGTQFDPKVVAALIEVVEQGVPVTVTASDGVRAVLAGAPVAQRRRDHLASRSRAGWRSAPPRHRGGRDLETAHDQSAPAPAMARTVRTPKASISAPAARKAAANAQALKPVPDAKDAGHKGVIDGRLDE